MSHLKILFNGIIKENPVFVLLLGMCPTLAVTTMAVNGLGMGLATTFVLLCSNVVISLVRKFIPKAVRLPCFIVIIAGFVTIVGFILQKFVPDLYRALGIFLSLITVNCIILARAEIFASKNTVVKSALDGLGMGLGFTLALFLMGSIREILGSGTWFGLPITKNVIESMKLFITPAGGFFVLGVLIAVINILTKYKISKKKIGCGGCEGCPSAEACEKLAKEEE
ncbi:MAG: electron transport complex subunit RsxE [Oscillospiraceae bacterium]|jgi:electron transport complex protein RnfE